MILNVMKTNIFITLVVLFTVVGCSNSLENSDDTLDIQTPTKVENPAGVELKSAEFKTMGPYSVLLITSWRRDTEITDLERYNMDPYNGWYDGCTGTLSLSFSVGDKLVTRQRTFSIDFYGKEEVTTHCLISRLPEDSIIDIIKLEVKYELHDKVAGEFSAGKYVAFESETIKTSKLQYTVEAVDLGLPSGTVWSAYNLGASNNLECGVALTWGGLTPDESTILGSNIPYWKQDAARKYLGNGWRTPGPSEYQELIDECEWEFGFEDGIPGAYAKRNGKYLFFPVVNPDESPLFTCNFWTDSPKDSFRAYAFGLSWHRDPDTGYEELQIRTPYTTGSGTNTKWGHYSGGIETAYIRPVR